MTAPNRKASGASRNSGVDWFALSEEIGALGRTAGMIAAGRGDDVSDPRGQMTEALARAFPCVDVGMARAVLDRLSDAFGEGFRSASENMAPIRSRPGLAARPWISPDGWRPLPAECPALLFESGCFIGVSRRVIPRGLVFGLFEAPAVSGGSDRLVAATSFSLEDGGGFVERTHEGGFPADAVAVAWTAFPDPDAAGWLPNGWLQPPDEGECREFVALVYSGGHRVVRPALAGHRAILDDGIEDWRRSILYLGDPLPYDDDAVLLGWMPIPEPPTDVIDSVH